MKKVERAALTRNVLDCLHRTCHSVELRRELFQNTDDDVNDIDDEKY